MMGSKIEKNRILVGFTVKEWGYSTNFKFPIIQHFTFEALWLRSYIINSEGYYELSTEIIHMVFGGVNWASSALELNYSFNLVTHYSWLIFSLLGLVTSLL